MSYINLHDSNLNSLNYQRSYTCEGYLRKGNILYIYIYGQFSIGKVGDLSTVIDSILILTHTHTL